MLVIISSGKSFKGLVDYITHDARDQAGDRPTTRDRVAWELCENLPTSDVDLAARIMASTVRDAPALKAAAGVSARGRKRMSPVLHIAMSWPKGAKVGAAASWWWPWRAARRAGGRSGPRAAVAGRAADRWWPWRAAGDAFRCSWLEEAARPSTLEIRLTAMWMWSWRSAAAQGA